MKKELVALLLLLLILAGNIWNQRRLDRLTAGLDRLTEKAFASARDGRWQEAEEAAGQAAQEWTEAGNYTHIFIRHTDIDAPQHRHPQPAEHGKAERREHFLITGIPSAAYSAHPGRC